MAGKKSSKKALQKMVAGAAKSVKAHPRSKKLGLSSEIVSKINKQLDQHGRTIQSIPISIIDLGENIRKLYDEPSLKRLQSSLEADGLIQFPTLCLRTTGKYPKLICRNGHRRIIAAKNLGWKKIECVILPFSSVRDELYHSINANMREDMFYLDVADAYEDAATLGETDGEISKRVGVNSRTVGWYRRLTKMSAKARELVRAHPEVFTATWAIKMARSGPLPSASQLERSMAQMLKGEASVGAKASPAEPADDYLGKLSRFRRQFRGPRGKEQLKWLRGCLQQLHGVGLLTERSLNRIEKEALQEDFSQKLSKGRVSAKTKGKSKRAAS